MIVTSGPLWQRWHWWRLFRHPQQEYSYQLMRFHRLMYHLKKQCNSSVWSINCLKKAVKDRMILNNPIQEAGYKWFWPSWSCSESIDRSLSGCIPHPIFIVCFFVGVALLVLVESAQISQYAAIVTSLLINYYHFFNNIYTFFFLWMSKPLLSYLFSQFERSRPSLLVF